VAAAANLAGQDAKPWQLNIEERLSRRAASQNKKLATNSSEPCTIRGKTEPELFFPTELFRSFIDSHMSHRSPRKCGCGSS
jgi:hypothetical protein